jgi:hypothetical protein
LHLHHAVALKIMKWAFGRIDGDLMEIGRAKPGFLRVEIGKQPSLEQGSAVKSMPGTMLAGQ